MKMTAQKILLIYNKHHLEKVQKYEKFENEYANNDDK